MTCRKILLAVAAGWITWPGIAIADPPAKYHILEIRHLRQDASRRPRLQELYQDLMRGTAVDGRTNSAAFSYLLLPKAEGLALIGVYLSQPEGSERVYIRNIEQTLAERVGSELLGAINDGWISDDTLADAFLVDSSTIDLIARSARWGIAELPSFHQQLMDHPIRAWFLQAPARNIQLLVMRLGGGRAALVTTLRDSASSPSPAFSLPTSMVAPLSSIVRQGAAPARVRLDLEIRPRNFDPVDEKAAAQHVRPFLRDRESEVDVRPLLAMGDEPAYASSCGLGDFGRFDVVRLDSDDKTLFLRQPGGEWAHSLEIDIDTLRDEEGKNRGFPSIPVEMARLRSCGGLEEKGEGYFELAFGALEIPDNLFPKLFSAKPGKPLGLASRMREILAENTSRRSSLFPRRSSADEIRKREEIFRRLEEVEPCLESLWDRVELLRTTESPEGRPLDIWIEMRTPSALSKGDQSLAQANARANFLQAFLEHEIKKRQKESHVKVRIVSRRSERNSAEKIGVAVIPLNGLYHPAALAAVEASQGSP